MANNASAQVLNNSIITITIETRDLRNMLLVTHNNNSRSRRCDMPEMVRRHGAGGVGMSNGRKCGGVMEGSGWFFT